MNSRHPSRERLKAWLETGETRRVESHIDRCDRCQSILEELSELDDAVLVDLQTMVTAPDDITDRTNSGLDERLRDEAAVGAFLDLFAIGWDVVRSIVEPTAHRGIAQSGDDAADGEHGGVRPNGGPR